MARSFTAASSQKLAVGANGPTGGTFSIFAWLNGTVNDSGYHTIYNDGSHGWWMFSGKLDWVGTSELRGSNILTNGQWTHCGWTSDGTTLNGYFAGALDPSGSVGQTLPTGANTGIGGHTSEYWDGQIAELAIWNAVLTANEITALAAGVLPWDVRPGSLTWYTPIWGLHSPEINLVQGAFYPTLSNAPPQANHAPVTTITKKARAAPLIQTGGGTFNPGWAYGATKIVGGAF